MCLLRVEDSRFEYIEEKNYTMANTKSQTFTSNIKCVWELCLISLKKLKYVLLKNLIQVIKKFHVNMNGYKNIKCLPSLWFERKSARFYNFEVSIFN